MNFKLILNTAVFGLGLALLFGSPTGTAVAHGGGLDGNGCHNDRKRGGYHCHRGSNVGKSYSSKSAYSSGNTAPAPQRAVSSDSGVVKMSNSGICHAPGTTYYSRTKNFRPYHSMEDCLEAGGRRPKG